MPRPLSRDCRYRQVGSLVRLAHIREGQAGGLGGSVDPIAKPLAPPAIHVKREHLVDDVVIEPAAAGALVLPSLQHRAFDFQEFARRERMSEIEDQEIVDEQIA